MAFKKGQYRKTIITCELCGKQELRWKTTRYCFNCRKLTEAESKRQIARRYRLRHPDRIRKQQKKQFLNRQRTMRERHDMERYGGHREEVLKRDNYSCQFPNCSFVNKHSKTGWLLVHHCDFSPSNNNPSNLITLCRQHHKWIHTVCGTIRKYRNLFPLNLNVATAI